MRIRSMVIPIAVTVLFLSACTVHNRVDMPAAGKYVMKGAPFEEWAWVRIEEENRFEFNRNLATSYRPRGTYRVEGHELILQANEDEVYRFELEENRMIFESGKYAEGLIEIGTVFEWTEDK